MVHTHYDNLRITRNATPGVIKAAYRALSQEFHPDRNPGRDTTRIMQIINDAYAVLSDPAARAKYDAKVATEDAIAGSSARAGNNEHQRRGPDEAGRERRAQEAAHAAERKRRADEAERQRQMTEEAERKRHAEAAAQQAQRDKAQTRGLWGLLIWIYIIGIVVLGIVLAASQVKSRNGADAHVAEAQAEPDVLNRPDLVRWVKGARDSERGREVNYAADIVKRDGAIIGAWIMRKYDAPVTSSEGKSRYSYAIEHIDIDCAAHTIENGAGLVYDQMWAKVAKFPRGELLSFERSSPDVRATATFLCSPA